MLCGNLLFIVQEMKSHWMQNQEDLKMCLPENDAVGFDNLYFHTVLHVAEIFMRLNTISYDDDI